MKHLILKLLRCFVLVIGLLSVVFDFAKSLRMTALDKTNPILSVNYHFTRKCNYKCGFCFHTSKTSHVEHIDQSMQILKLLKDSGCKKINFAGGEPFLPEYRERLGQMVKYAKKECGYDSVSIISNGVYINEPWFAQYSKYLDILGISCDSSDENINKKIGRGHGNHLATVRNAANLCHKYGVMFKLNTVVNSYNWQHDMSALVNEVNPMRWKLFQVLSIEDENSGPSALRDVARFLISPEQYAHFIDTHRERVENSDAIIKVENNEVMRSSYTLVDEYGRFLDCSTGNKQPTQSVLEVGVEAALAQLLGSAGGGFDAKSFQQREGEYQWAKSPCATR